MPRAAVVGSGPNGLAGAIVLAQAGYEVEVFEAAAQYGGAVRSGALTLPGFVHDLGSAVYAFGLASPFFRSLHLERFGLRWIQPESPLAHPFDDGTAVVVERDIYETARQLGRDAGVYRRIFKPLSDRWDDLVAETLRPLRIPRSPLLMARFGLNAILPATVLARRVFDGPKAKAVFAGNAAHSILPLTSKLSSAFGLILGASAHAVGWPIAAGGAQAVSTALVLCLESLGGRVKTEARITSLDDLGPRDIILCDITPNQLLQLAGKKLLPSFRFGLKRYRYGPAAFKMDWALSQPVPWKAKECLRAGTVHLGGSIDEIAASEEAAWKGTSTPPPFVLLSQPSLFDPARAPKGLHTLWAYCHVPNGSTASAAERIEAQIERFAPGFRDCVLARNAWGPAEMQQWNANLVGGDINGGAFTPKQFVARPTWRQYGTSISGVFLCSSATPPGGGVHGMCGYFAAKRALEQQRSR